MKDNYTLHLSHHQARGLNAALTLINELMNVPPNTPVYPTRSLDNNALIQLESRQALRVCWLKAGLTPCGSYIQTGHSGHSWITNLNGGRRTKACDSITFCSHRIRRTGSWTPVFDRSARGQENASDHAPKWIMLDL